MNKAMNLQEKQCVFSQNVAKLILFAKEKGLEVTLGEALRTQEQQDYYVRNGVCKTHASRHLSRLAIDLNVFAGGKLSKDPEDYERLGNYWHTLNKWNVWGGIWKKHPKSGHFEMR